MRKLASIRIVSDTFAIEGADRIHVALVDSWKVVVSKEIQKGDKVVYCEIDSFLPIRPEFEFLRKSCYKKLSTGVEGFRLRTIKLKGQISQGLCIPLKELPYLENVDEGQDVTEILGITKYEPPVPAQLVGVAKGSFPAFLKKTDEERIQNLSKEYQDYLISGKHFYATEKLDGSSATFYLRDGEFGVCSRNLELTESDSNAFWKVARELDLAEKLKTLPFNACLQGELVGGNIQGNPYKLGKLNVFFFNLFNIDKYETVPVELLFHFCASVGLSTVPKFGIALPKTVDDLLLLAEGKSVINPEVEREGLVIRSTDSKISFKVISNRWLLQTGN